MVENNTPIQTFDAQAAIREYLKEKPDWRQTARDAANKAVRDVADGKKVADLATRNTESFVDAMRRLSEGVDPKYRPQAARMVEANDEWIKAQEKKDVARELKDEKAAEKQQRKQDRLNREIQTFELFQSIKESSEGTTAILGEISAARVSADIERGKQASVNRLMTIIALILAAGSFGMPFVEEFVWKDPPPKPEVVLIQESDLTVPPLLRRLGG